MTKRISNACGALLVALLVTLLAACESSDCTLQNHIALKCGFYAGGRAVSLNAPLTVTAAGTDSLIINRQGRAGQIDLPLSYWQACDTFVLHVLDEPEELRDTLWVEKTNEPHFESPDCPSYMFHRITALRCTHTFIDSVHLAGDRVDFSEYEQIQIHLFAAE